MSNGPKQKSLGKMSQRNQLAHSRVSSNGFKTDRKMGNKDENNIRSSYY